MAKQRIRITDTTLRDAHQSLWATRMRLDDILPIAEKIDNVGYYSVEVWGGATFDVCLRFLNEDPWERLTELKKVFQKTPLQMLLRGQNILGYRNYPDDVLELFIEKAVEHGINIFRIFDALNDVRNLEKSIQKVKSLGAHPQGTICYTISPVHTIQHYVEVAQKQEALGVESLCIKDMAGILSPHQAKELLSALKKQISVPVQLHCHSSSGMAVATYFAAMEAGAEAIDCAISPLSFYSSQPSTETMVAIAEDSGFDTNVQLDDLLPIADYFEGIAKEKGYCHQNKPIVDINILTHQIPGGMISNLHSQLEKQDAIDKLPQVLDEIPKVREDLGFPPLVTPTSQIVGVQAVMNILAGERYKIVPRETRDYLRCLYGRPPAPMNQEVVGQILHDEKPVEGRPADLLEPLLPKLTKGLNSDLIMKDEDLLSYALFPESALRFFKWRLEPEKYPSEDELAKQKAEQAAEAKQQQEIDDQAEETRVRAELRPVNELIDKLIALKVDTFAIQTHNVNFEMRKQGSLAMPVARTTEPTDQQVETPATDAQEEKVQTTNDSVAPKQADRVATITAPLNGTFYGSPRPGEPVFVKAGDVVEKGHVLCIVEAMKMFNEIETEFPCRILKACADDSSPVTKGQTLFEIEKL